MKKYSIALVTTLCFFLSVADKGLVGQTRTIQNLLGQKISTDSIDAFLGLAMEQLKVPGLSLAIINDGVVSYSTVKGYSDLAQQEKVEATTIFEGASLSKPLFAYFVMTFVETGQLDLDRPLFEYLPYEVIAYDPRYKKITARMVLSHTSGFPNWRSDGKENKLTINFEPGSSFGYSGEGYQYLAKVLAHMLHTDDKGLEAIYQKRIAQPLDLKYTKFIQDEYNRNNKALPYQDGKNIKGEGISDEFGSAYSIHSNATDFSKWIIALMNKKGLTTENYAELFKAQIQLPEGAPQREQGVSDWTLGFAKAPLPFGTLYAHGGNNPGYTSLFAFNPEKKWGFVLFTNADQSLLPLQLLMYINTMH